MGLYPTETEIGYELPFRFDLLLDFLRYRAIEGVEVVRGGCYYRTVRLEMDEAVRAAPVARYSQSAQPLQSTQIPPDEQASQNSHPTQPVAGWIKVVDQPEKSCLKVTVSPELLKDLPSVLLRVRRLFDVDCSPATVETGLQDFHTRIPQSHIPGIRIPCCFDGFEMAVRAILGQQVTVKAANTMAGRVAATFGSPVQLPVEGLTTAFGSPVLLPVEGLTTVFPPPLIFCTPGAAEKLGELGVVRQRSQAICRLAEAFCKGEIELHPGADIEKAAAGLLAIPGIGDWTVQYLLMRAFDYTDAFPATDHGVRCAFPDMKEKALRELSGRWSPWRSYAVMSLWCTPHD